MSSANWDGFLKALRSDYDADRLNFSDTGRFREFVKQVPPSGRVPLLLHAYAHYKATGPAGEFDREHYFQSSAYSILISTILNEKLDPSDENVSAILRNSFHFCGHGCDVESPVDLAEKGYYERPYSSELFDAVNAYRETLRPVRSIAAQNAKRKLEWISWHDPRHSLQGCWTGRMRSDIAAMSDKEAFQWQWLLRNTAGGLNAAPGKAWIKEAQKRLAPIGEEAFLQTLDAWFAFPANEAVRLSPSGSCMLRVLVWYGSLVSVDHSLPILVRIADVQWHKREPAQKIASAVAWLLRTRGDRRYEKAIAALGKEWASDSGEVARMQETFDPAEATQRKAQDQQQIEQSRKQTNEGMQDLMRLMTTIASRLSK